MQRNERAIAVARAILLAGMLAVAPNPAAQNAAFAITLRILTAAYFAHSVLVLLLAWKRPDLAIRLRSAIHLADLAWVAVVTARPTNVFFVFSTLTLLAAAYRWGFRETAATAGAALATTLLQLVLLASLPPGDRPSRRPPDATGVVVRCGHLLTLGLLLGYLAEREKRSRAEAAVAERLLARVQRERSLPGLLAPLFSELRGIFDASRVLVVLRERATDRTVLWEEPGTAGAEPVAREIAPASEMGMLAGTSGSAWHAGRRRDGSTDVLVLNDDGQRMAAREPPTGALKLLGTQSLVTLAVAGGAEWSGNLLAPDAELGRDREALLRLGQRLVRELAPAVYGAYLVQRLRERAGAIERSRIARELHDGIVQAVIGIEMELEVVRRRLGEESSRATGDVGRIGQLLHDQVLDLRALMQQMRVEDVPPDHLVHSLAAAVDRFRRDSGIDAQFVADVDEVPLSPRACRELFRVVQEALVNVRKHSGARHALVRLGAADGGTTLVVDDDGCGFPFQGSLSHAELEARRCGPTVIRDRIRSIGGSLTIASVRGVGSTLTVTIPSGLRA